MSFQKLIKIKLCCYKKSNFSNYPDVIYRGKPYGHILPIKHREENFIETYRNNIIHSRLYDPKKLHIYFSHLNSSQAMCFNFFYPIFHEAKLELITDFLGIFHENVNYKTVCFEKDGLEVNYGRIPTSFDFYFETNSGKKFYFEIKYTETEFGKAKVNLDKFDHVYSNHLNSLNTIYKGRDEFFKNYQICRNLIHIDKNSFVVFIYPKDNKKINEGAMKAKSEILSNDFASNFFPITWEALHNDVIKSVTEPKLITQLELFRNKYFM